MCERFLSARHIEEPVEQYRAIRPSVIQVISRVRLQINSPTFFFLYELTTKINNLTFSLPDMPILGSSNSATNKNMMSKIWTNGVQLCDLKENILGKGEIAHYKQFLLLPQCFKKLMIC